MLAHSLRDAGTAKKLAVLVTLETVSGEVVTQLKSVFDYVIPVNRIRNSKPANLYLMDRPDLHSAFTKINLWKQTQFRKIVYLDADVVAYRAPDELFDLPHAFSAAPDIGWPDLFNTGVMVLKPDIGEFYALLAMAERGISFDGADQGLLNLHFQNNYNRLSFTYNVTPSAHYQYIPAYRHFQAGINMVHFIGSDKPWFQGRDASTGDGPFNDMVGRWWAVYDRHYRRDTNRTISATGASHAGQSAEKVPEIVQHFVQGEYRPTVPYVVSVGQPAPDDGSYHGQPSYPHQNEHNKQHHSDHAQSHHEPHSQHSEGLHAQAHQDQGHEQQHHHEESQTIPQQPSWDAQREPPPPGSRPEAANFPAMHYEMSSDSAPFVPPPRYPSPPKNMWYEVPKERPAPPAAPPKAIFPWETHRPRVSRVFADPPPEPEPPVAEQLETQAPAERNVSDQHPPETEPASGSSTAGHSSQPASYAASPGQTPSSDAWGSFSNAWDAVPQIERYVDKLQQKHRRTKSAGMSLGKLPSPSVSVGTEGNNTGRRSSKVTDFPGDRPSLPVTPAPVRRPRFWGGSGPGASLGAGEDAENNELLPAAEGVPAQSEWDPVAQLQKLAQQQSELLLQKFSGTSNGEQIAGGEPSTTIGIEGKEIPKRPLPFGSEDAKSPTYVAQSPPVHSPTPVKPESGASLAARLQSGHDDSIARTDYAASTTEMEEPSYHGPGAAFEKGEDYLTQDTPALPTEEEQDVLDT